MCVVGLWSYFINEIVTESALLFCKTRGLNWKLQLESKLDLSANTSKQPINNFYGNTLQVKVQVQGSTLQGPTQLIYF